jgi:hypothetical protein
VAPLLERSFAVFLRGVKPPSARSMSSHKTRMMLGLPFLASGAGGLAGHSAGAPKRGRLVDSDASVSPA